MSRPLVYLDECMKLALLPRLRRRGFMVSSAHRTAMAGENDDAQLRHAAQVEAVILTENDRHFRLLHRRVQPHSGIVVIAGDVSLDLQEIRAAMLLDWLATMDDYRSQLFRWGQLQQLLTGGFRLDGYGEDEVRRALGQ